jgi:pentose-5-phosphate-3-epimerase
MLIIPTLLTTSQAEFTQQMGIFQQYYSRIQLDVADGILVPNKTTQIEEMISLFSENESLFSKKAQFDFHLMVKDFKAELDKIKKLHEMGMNVNVALINAKLHPEINDLTIEYPFNIGLDVSPDTQIEEIARLYNLNFVKTIQIMTVNPGFQGSPFLEEMLTKIEQLRIVNYKLPIMIDGGVNNITIPLIQNKKIKPDFLCIGSYLTKAGSELEKRVNELNNL